MTKTVQWLLGICAIPAVLGRLGDADMPDDRSLFNSLNQTQCPDGSCVGRPYGTIAPEELWLSHPNIFYRCTSPGLVALTFDDGPSEATPKVLAELQRNNVTATFFINGNRINEKTGPYLAKLEYTGNLVASHTFSHVNLTTIASDEAALNEMILNEFIKNEQAAKPYLQHGLQKYVRPPYLEMTESVVDKLAQNGYVVVQINADTNDFQYTAKDTQVMVNAITDVMAVDEEEVATNSYITLQHDTYEHTAAVIEPVVTFAKSKGYRFVTVDECLGDATLPPVPEVTFPTAAPTRTNLVSHLSQCTGAPCPKRRECRSEFGFCGTGEEFCTKMSMWRIDCDYQYADYKWCGGSACVNPNHCRNANGFCGPGDSFCNRDATWTSQCPVGSCHGMPCEVEGACRSPHGFCGTGAEYCNAAAIWEPNCQITTYGWGSSAGTKVAGSLTKAALFAAVVAGAVL